MGLSLVSDKSLVFKWRGGAITPPNFEPYARTPRELLVIPNKKIAYDLYAIILVIIEENNNMMIKKIV